MSVKVSGQVGLKSPTFLFVDKSARLNLASFTPVSHSGFKLFSECLGLVEGVIRQLKLHPGVTQQKQSSKYLTWPT